MATNKAIWGKSIPLWLRNGGPKGSRRWLKQFRVFCTEQHLGSVGCGFGVSASLRWSIAALRNECPDRLDEITTDEQLRQVRQSFDDRLAVIRRERSMAQDADRMARLSKAELDMDGRYVLMAGENTEVVYAGKFLDCCKSLPLVCGLPTDPHDRIGCWVIVGPDGEDVATGTFTICVYHKNSISHLRI